MGGAFGAAMGSFLGVVIERSSITGKKEEGKRKKDRKETLEIVGGRSLCLGCGRQLKWWENIPVISFIFLTGRCRTCHSPIPYWLPLIEISGAAAGAAIAARMGQISLISLIGLICVAAGLIWIFFSDLVYGMIPDWAVLIGAGGAIAMRLMSPMSPMSLMAQVAAAAGAAGFFWLLVMITRGKGMGMGDVTLAFFLGLWLGWPAIAVAIYLAFILGATVGVGLILLGKKRFGQTIPFGPFMIIGSLLALQWGKQLQGLVF